LEKAQPSQSDFENLIAVDLLKLETQLPNRKLIIEDESRLIGRNAIPKPLFDKMRSSSVVWVEESLETRVENIYQDYILYSGRSKLELFTQFKNAVQAISTKLGSQRAGEMTALIQSAENDYLQSGRLEQNRIWIERLLVYYYDPMYLQSIDKRQVRIVFKGSRLECEKYLAN
jgi:tRNA 2-selenouridine synthase